MTRKFSTKEARLAKSNYSLFVSMTIIEAFLLLMFTLQFITAINLRPMVIVPPMIFLAMGLVTNFIYFKDRSSSRFRVIAMAFFMLAYAWINLSGGSVCVVMYILPSLYCLILYSDALQARLLGIYGIVIMALRMIVGFATKGFDGMSDEFIMILTS